MKAKGINVGETEIGKILGESVLKPKERARTLPAAR